MEGDRVRNMGANNWDKKIGDIKRDIKVISTLEYRDIRIGDIKRDIKVISTLEYRDIRIRKIKNKYKK
ncbi:hypothetical protein CWI37_2269p0010 [Hamiltosporidium tvaerminnensis]|uniref:Uncharacterized protein n=1 Tax=Hamiltosporidium tvaerminnensis TaxID=1176355 RepID=A0A4Q9KU13_9MICR|nr:hypothetical protein CWI37_2269p0010 [Hamiltosporidium tvaerminnensis]